MRYLAEEYGRRFGGDLWADAGLADVEVNDWSVGEARKFAERHGLSFTADGPLLPREYGQLFRKYVTGVKIHLDDESGGWSFGRRFEEPVSFHTAVLDIVAECLRHLAEIGEPLEAPVLSAPTDGDAEAA